MLVNAIENYAEFRITKVEFDRPDVSFTVDTLLNFCRYEKIKTADLYYIIGMDNFLEFPLWKDPEKILELSKTVVMNRPGYTLAPHIQKYLDSVILLETPLLPVSSTEIRRLVAKGLPYKHLVPAGVGEIIEAHRLYQSD